MIQRVQSIFLILAAICGVFILLFPLASFDASILPAMESQNSDTVVVFARDYLPVLVTAFITLSLCLAGVFLYRNRPLQARVASMALLLMILLIAFFLYFVWNAISSYGFQLGSVYPVLAIVFLILAIRGIKKDENLVRSADRFR